MCTCHMNKAGVTKKVSQSTDAACIVLQYFVMLSIVALMLTHLLVIIINQSTITISITITE